MALFIVAANVITRWWYFRLQRSVGKYLQPSYEGHVLGYVSHFNMICGDSYISDFFLSFHKKIKIPEILLLTYLLTPWIRVLLEKLTRKLCS